MTEQEIRVASFNKSVILPKLQEMQRDLCLDEHIHMEVISETYKLCLSAYFHVTTNSDGSIYGGSEHLCRKEFCFPTYLCDEEKSKNRALKALRGIRWFIKNWQKRLQA